MFRKLLDEARAGDNVGLLLRGVKKENIQRGQVIAKPGSIKPHKKFKAEIYVLSKEEGGRHTAFFSNYRPQFYFRTTDVTAAVKLPEGVEMVMPGDNVQLEIELLHAHRHGEDHPLRHPRGFQDRRRRPCVRDPRLKFNKSTGRRVSCIGGRAACHSAHRSVAQLVE